MTFQDHETKKEDLVGASTSEELARVNRELRTIEKRIETLLHRQAELHESKERLQRVIASEIRAPRADWAGCRSRKAREPATSHDSAGATAFPWDQTIAILLQSVFHLSSWRPLQREAINATMQGRDVLCLMPSGGGKSLCYQLPALAADPGSVTLVVSPLLALIVDQVGHLNKLNIASASLTSLSSKEEASAVLKSLQAAETSPRLLYVTPERLVSSKRFLSVLDKLYKSGRFTRVAIDESHCASQWGNDWRPDYKKLGILRQQFPLVPIIALTATATSTVCHDIMNILRIDGAETFRNSVDRPNLFYEVKSKPAAASELAGDIASWITANFPHGESGICYCLTRKDAESLAADLNQRGIASAAYHADMDPTTRMSVQAAWTDDRLQVIAATISFGMGVSKADVRFVIHHSMSKSVENYYQESGRAGRDGKPAHCRLYYRFSDYLRQAAVVSMDSGWEPHLIGMIGYSSASGCRRAVICRHFSEAPAPCRGMCDWCKASETSLLEAQSTDISLSVAQGGEDVTAEAKKVLQVLNDWTGAEKRATLVQLVDKYRGKGKHTGFGLDRAESERMIEAMVAAEALHLDFGFTAYSTNVYLKAGPKAGLVQAGRMAICLPPSPPQTTLTKTANRPHENHADVDQGKFMLQDIQRAGAIHNSQQKEGCAWKRKTACRSPPKPAGEHVSGPAAVVVDLVDGSDEDDFVLPAKRASK